MTMRPLSSMIRSALFPALPLVGELLPELVGPLLEPGEASKSRSVSL